jgi:hypothetical protein
MTLKEEAFDKHVAAATLDPRWSITNLQYLPIPQYDFKTQQSHLVFACAANVTDGTEDHAVVVATTMVDSNFEYSFWCTDKFLELDALPNVDAKQRATEAVTSAGAHKSLVDTLLANKGAYKKSTPGCKFWQNWRRAEELCEHTSAMLSHLRTHEPDLKAKLTSGYEALLTSTSHGTSAPGETLVLEDLAFKVPVLFEGDRGAGKTVTARAFAKTNSFLRVELPGHDGVEAIDMLGCLVPAPDGTMVWKDGALSEAIRKAKKQKVVLIIDELLRIRTRELSVLLTAFSPDDGEYRVRTGRIIGVEDGVAQEEELSCPVSNLCVVATTNVGSEYAVDEIDPALAERFVVLRKDTSEAELKRILNIVAKSKGLKVASVTRSINFYNKMVEACSRGLLARAPTTRTMVRAFDLASDEAGIARALKTQLLLWVARTSEGTPVPEQVDVVKKLVDATFK